VGSRPATGALLDQDTYFVNLKAIWPWGKEFYLPDLKNIFLCNLSRLKGSEVFYDEESVQPMPYSYSSGQSRLQVQKPSWNFISIWKFVFDSQSEFSYMGEIGKGGFGEVIKVKNKLDSQVYAIKRIRLDPNNRQLTKKIMREVKLLSRLNHENVVRWKEVFKSEKSQTRKPAWYFFRYYNSWIEVTSKLNEQKDSEDDDDGSEDLSYENSNKLRGDEYQKVRLFTSLIIFSALREIDLPFRTKTLRISAQAFLQKLPRLTSAFPSALIIFMMNMMTRGN